MEKEGCEHCGFLMSGHKELNNVFYPSHRPDFGSESILGGNSVFERLFSIWPEDNARSFSALPGISSASWSENIEAMRPMWLIDELKRLFPETKSLAPRCLFPDPEPKDNLSVLPSQQRMDINYFTSPQKEMHVDRQQQNVQDNQQMWVKKARFLFELETEFMIKKNDSNNNSDLMQKHTPPQKIFLQENLPLESILLTDYNSQHNLSASTPSKNYESVTKTFSDSRESHNIQNPCAQDHVNQSMLRKSQMTKNDCVFVASQSTNTDSDKSVYSETYFSNLKCKGEEKLNFNVANLDKISNNSCSECLPTMKMSSNSMSSRMQSSLDELKNIKLSNEKQIKKEKVHDDGDAVPVADAGNSVVQNKALNSTKSSLNENDVMAALSDFPLLSIKPNDQSAMQRQQQRCSFCAKNGEMEAMVTSHSLYDPETNLVQCPILRAYKCEACQATGDFAHTRSYCPRIRMLEGRVRSATIALRSTRRQANGSLRNTSKKCIFKSMPKYTITRI